MKVTSKGSRIKVKLDSEEFKHMLRRYLGFNEEDDRIFHDVRVKINVKDPSNFFTVIYTDEN